MKTRIINKPLRSMRVRYCLVIILLAISSSTIYSQANPLSLAKVLTGLQARSGDFTLAEKNEFITKEVRQKGVTFRLTPEIEKEMRDAGASSALIEAIRVKNRQTSSNPDNPADEKPNADYEKIWVEPLVMENGVSGIRILANFSVYNLKDVKSDIVYRFRKDGVMLKGSTTDFRTSTGELSARRYLTPAYSATVYNELGVFVPYSEFNLVAPGVYNLEMDADVILRDGTIVKHLTWQNVKLEIPSRTLRKNGTATLSNLWIDYNFEQEGEKGMLIHVKFTINGMKDQDAKLLVLFTKSDDTILKSTRSRYSTSGGQTAAYKTFRPLYDATNFNDLSVFIPYSEFNLPVGKYDLKLHADLVYSDDTQLSHLDYKAFTYTRSK